MKELSFFYNGHKFEPIGNILGGFKEMSKAFTTNSPFPGRFSYSNFYKAARENHAVFDVYRIDDSQDFYMPGGSNDFCVFYKIVKFSKLKFC